MLCCPFGLCAHPRPLFLILCLTLGTQPDAPADAHTLALALPGAYPGPDDLAPAHGRALVPAGPTARWWRRRLGRGGKRRRWRRERWQ